MKRLSLHILFWTFYLTQDTVLVFTWVGPSLGKMSDLELTWVSFSAAFVMLLPKLLLFYFILFYTLPKIEKGVSGYFYSTVEVLIALLITILFYRILSKYFVNPVIYENAIKSGPLIDIRRTLMAIMDIGFVTGLAVTLRLIRVQVKNKEREKNLVKEKLGAELKFLRNQANPHFLMNTLNNIYGLARKKSDDTPEVVLKLSELLRFMLYESNETFISLADELKVLEDYLELEKMRYNNRLTIAFFKQIDDEKYLITPMLLLPFVENAFKHGVSETRFESFINIDVKATEGKLNFHIENSKALEAGNGTSSNIGLANVKRQLELVYTDYKLEVDNSDTIYRVNLEVNLNCYAKL